MAIRIFDTGVGSMWFTCRVSSSVVQLYESFRVGLSWLSRNGSKQAVFGLGKSGENGEFRIGDTPRAVRCKQHRLGMMSQHRSVRRLRMLWLSIAWSVVFDCRRFLVLVDVFHGISVRWSSRPISENHLGEQKLNIN